MENTEKVKKYEIMVILDANMAQDKKDATVKVVEKALTDEGAKIVESKVWMEKHTLTFEINKCKEGTYYLITFDSETPAISKVTDTLKLNDNILRFGITKLNSKTTAEVA